MTSPIARGLVVAVVGCGKSKLSKPAPARELYTGSLFRAARRVAETCDRWLIASARYGIVTPELVLAPYEYRLGPKDRQQWGHAAANAIVCELLESGPYELVLLAGEDYTAPIAQGMRHEDGWRCNCVDVTRPLAGMGLGARMSWLSQRVAVQGGHGPASAEGRP
jgi:hypothetical protein